MGKVKKFLSVISAAAVTVASALGGVQVSVFAESKEVSVVSLITDKKAKTFGRYAVVDGKMQVEWSAGGFEINVQSKADTEMRVVCDTNEKIYLAVFVDGEALDRESPISEHINDIYIPIKKGKHTVRILRDSGNSANYDAYFYFDKLEFDGKILDAPKDNDMFIEVIGDSIACGLGSLGTYTAGQAWRTPEDHSGVKGFGYKVAEGLGADYSIVARGGIGLFSDKAGSQEAVEDGKTTMQQIYPYTNGNSDLTNKTNPYSFERKPDLILLELGANDGTNAEEQWRKAYIDFVKELRNRNGNDVPIVWVGKNQTHFLTVTAAINDELKDDGHLYALVHEYGGSGSAALATQKAGHPSAAEQTVFAKTILKFLKTNNIIDVPDEKPKTKTEKTESTDTKSSTVKTAAIAGGVGAAAVAAAIITAVSVRKKKKKKEKENTNADN